MTQPALTPAQYVSRIDKVAQERFKINMGKFGPDRVQHDTAQGHPEVDGFFDGQTKAEDGELKTVAKSPYFAVLGIMHLRHKPGTHGEAAQLVGLVGESKLPSAGVIEASGTTMDRASRTFDWAQGNIEHIVLSHAKQARRGESVDFSYQKFYVAIRPVQASSHTCIGCHTGTRIGDTLGAMIYMVAKTPTGQPAKSMWGGGGE